MKKRIISAAIALLIMVPIIIIGGNLYKVGVIAVATIALVEFIKLIKPPSFVKVLTVFNFLVLLFYNVDVTDFGVSLPISLILLNILTLLLPLILYHDKEKYGIKSAMLLIGVNIFLAIAFILLIVIRDYSIAYLVLILLITILSDTFAYIVGNLIGRHKLAPAISPNKSIEGFIGGLVFSTFITTILYTSIFNYTANIYILILAIMFLSIMSTLGDLTFSAIKRYFDIKDFGKIMPGHGGVLDRLDSLIFVLLTFYLVINFL